MIRDQDLKYTNYDCQLQNRTVGWCQLSSQRKESGRTE